MPRKVTLLSAIAAAALTAAAILPLAANTGGGQGPTVAAATYDHMSINVADFDRALVWYRDALGFEVEVAWRVAALDGKRLAYLVKNGTRIELVAADAGSAGLPPAASFSEHFGRTGFGHLCFAVDNVDAALAELEANGVPTFVRAETYALDGTPFERRVAFVQDPEGNVIEFAEPLRRAAGQ